MIISRRGFALSVPAIAASQALPRRLAAQPATLQEEANELLRRLSDALARQASLAVDFTVLREVRAHDGRTVTLMTEVGVAMRRPDRLRADLRGDALFADVYYDGRQVTIHAPLHNAYSQTDAPPTIDGALALLSDRLGVPIEIGNLLVADPYARLAPGTFGESVASLTVSGRPSWHLIMQSGETAWELWLDRSELPLPLLASIRRDGHRTLLRFNDWRLAPRIEDALFRFTPPADARRLPLGTRQEAASP